VRPFTSTIPFHDALRIALDATSAVTRTETIPISDADGRVAAADIVSTMDVPPFDRSAMDGYAVRSTDCATPGAVLRVVGRVFTGEVFSGEAGGLRAGECVEIATGAPMPAGADAVVMVEDTVHDAGRSDRQSGQVTIRIAAKAGANIGRRAADIAHGAAVVSRGDTLTPSRVGALAAVGVPQVLVFRRPTVAIVSTGNEVVAPGLPLSPGHIYDINRYTLAAVVQRHGGHAVALASPGDAIDQLERTLDAAAAYDLIVFSGGSSVGDRDLVRDVIAARGSILFHGIAVKPGKPTAFATIGASVFLGMPGNPTSCLSNAYLLMIPVLRKLAGLPAWEPRTVTVPLARRIASANDRHQFYTVRLANGLAEPAFKGSGDITSMAHADGYIEIPANTPALDAGVHVHVTLF
jgi:molybdenum cofactor synthesis domain-containing protein